MEARRAQTAASNDAWTDPDARRQWNPREAMSTALRHLPSRIVAQLLIDKAEGTDPTPWATGTGNPWPIASGGEMNSPDSTITVYGTAPRGDGRSMKADHEGKRHHGLQFRVRSEDRERGGE